MATATPRWCGQCGRLVWHRLSHDMCNACYQADRAAYGPRDPDPQQTAWAQTGPKLNDPDHDWWPAAACRGLDPNLFFPELGEPTAPAKAVCAGCPVRARCLDYALANGIRYGTWGGATEQERRTLRRTRKQQATAA